MSGFSALYPARCGDCGEPIDRGDQVVYVNDVEVHVECEGLALTTAIELEGNDA